MVENIWTLDLVISAGFVFQVLKLVTCWVLHMLVVAPDTKLVAVNNIGEKSVPGCDITKGLFSRRACLHALYERWHKTKEQKKQKEGLFLLVR